MKIKVHLKGRRISETISVCWGNHLIFFKKMLCDDVLECKHMYI